MTSKYIDQLDGLFSMTVELRQWWQETATGPVFAGAFHAEDRLSLSNRGSIAMGYPYSWMVDFMEKSQSKMDDDWGYPPFMETTKYVELSSLF